MAKKVSFNSRKKMYIVTEEGKRGIQFQGKNVPEFDESENVIWLCDKPGEKDVFEPENSVSEMAGSDSVSDSEIMVVDSSTANKEAVAKAGIFKGLFRSQI